MTSGFDEAWEALENYMRDRRCAVDENPRRVPKDSVESPSHYKIGGIEVIDVIAAKLTYEELIGYCKGNVIKYMLRSGHKGNRNDAVTDLKKADQYLTWLLTAIGEQP